MTHTKDFDLSILTITVLARHPCGAVITLHGDEWDEVHGICVACDDEYHLSFLPEPQMKVDEEA